MHDEKRNEILDKIETYDSFEKTVERAKQNVTEKTRMKMEIDNTKPFDDNSEFEYGLRFIMKEKNEMNLTRLSDGNGDLRTTKALGPSRKEHSDFHFFFLM